MGQHSPATRTAAEDVDNQNREVRLFVRKRLGFMAKSKQQKKKNVQEIVASGTKSQRCVLVATYKKQPDQLEWIRKRRLYNYSLSAEEVQATNDGWNNVKELWLYSGTKDKRHIYAAEFIGIKSRKDFLAEHPDYPKGKGKGHGDFYAVFKTTFKYQPTLDESVVVVRAADFKRTPKVAQAVRAYRAGGELGCLLDYLPAELAPFTHDQLRVCEAAVQLNFWDMPELKSLKPTVPFPPPEKPKFTFIDLFAGIGGIRLGYQLLGGKCVFSSEWDKAAAKTYYCNFGEQPFGDIRKIDPNDIPDFDILLAGFPCQPFSIIGDKEGFSHETQGTLFFNIEKILLAKRPKAFMLENVRNLTAHDGGRTFKIILAHLMDAGYDVHYKVLNALDYGVPQKRERIIICGFQKPVDFEFPPPIPKEKRATVADIIDKAADNDPTLRVRPAIRESRLERLKDKSFPKPYISHENVAGSITPHTYSCALRAGASANYILINDERRPSPREMLRIQGFPDEFKVVVNYGQIKHQTGNSVAVPVIKAVAECVVEKLKEL